MHFSVLLFFFLMTFFPVSLFAFLGIIEDFRAPLHSEDNQQAGEVKGETAKYLDDNTIEIHKAFAWIQKEGSLNKRIWEFKTDQCVFKQKDNLIQTENPVLFQSKGMAIRGNGMEWSFSESKITVLKNVVVDMNQWVFQHPQELGKK